VHPRRRHTWTSPGDRTRNQIDYIMISSRFRNAIKSSHSYPGADVDSDHNPVVAKFRISLKRIAKPRPRPKFDFSVLQGNKEICENFKAEVLRNLPEELPGNIEEHYSLVTTSIHKAAAKHIPTTERRKPSSHWFNPELEDLLRKRRMLKNEEQQYKLINSEFKRKCREAKEQWLQKKCKEVENLSCNAGEMFRKIKEITGSKSSPPSKFIKSADGLGPPGHRGSGG